MFLWYENLPRNVTSVVDPQVDKIKDFSELENPCLKCSSKNGNISVFAPVLAMATLVLCINDCVHMLIVYPIPDGCCSHFLSDSTFQYD